MKPIETCGLALLLSLCTTLSAHADEAPASAPADALTVVRDADTGKLRTPDAKELAALQSSNARSQAASGKAARKAAIKAASASVRSLPNGAHTARLPQTLASYVIVKRLPDGSLDSTCVDGDQAATDELATPAPAKSPAATVPPAQ